MKKEFTKIILAASLALNIAFSGAAVYRWLHRPEAPASPDAMGAMEDLSPDQRNQLDRIVQTFRISLAENKSDILDARMDIVDILGDPEFKNEDLEVKLKELNQIENEMNYEFVSTLQRIGEVLNSEQWLRFLYRLSRSWFFTSIGSSG